MTTSPSPIRSSARRRARDAHTWCTVLLVMALRAPDPPRRPHRSPSSADADTDERLSRRWSERAQSTVEYALLLLGAAAIALVVVAWVTRTDLIGRLFDTVVGRILSQAG